ncbi:MAG: hypothetical protein Q8P41_04890 [Pseudomonadota bacterium]|nr:hypothetical protein [Pseudomonadota bacterium]
MARKKSDAQQRHDDSVARLLELRVAHDGWSGGPSDWRRDDGVEVRRVQSHDTSHGVWEGRKTDADTWGRMGSSAETAMAWADSTWPRVVPTT